MSRIYFREIQKMKQKWVWFIMILVIGIWLWGFIQQVILGIPFGDRPATDLGLIIIGIIVIAPFFILLKVKLIFEIRKDGLYYKMSLLMGKFKKIRPNDIGKYYIRTYNPLREYGGWGIRTGWGRKSGKAYNMSGRIGLQLELKNNKKILLGTHKPEDLIKAMDKMMDNTTV